MQEVLGEDASAERDRNWAQDRDPACGMALSDPESECTAIGNENRYGICSESCVRKFRERPSHYLQAFTVKEPNRNQEPLLTRYNCRCFPEGLATGGMASMLKVG